MSASPSEGTLFRSGLEDGKGQQICSKLHQQPDAEIMMLLLG